ncbi:nucleoside/nucleotide kinase family protein [Microlunatus panaciterrae]|uniref:Pantothenate kinase n=1 Tax=Microlunatus panaciterrae TaxID=400768 RepID=A0ABS2RHQ4_9ACTN|nr:nucleoside/nucleotide kinase family protein [Microlunatus panaciterrae]MBM7798530.1 pantothenate kinase [Microlunatus panaciterrae]
MEQISWPGRGFDTLVGRATALLQRPGRAVLGIAGAPGSGKSTLADELTAAIDDDFPGQVVQVGMDAFHLAQRVLNRHGLAHVKGAPETFDCYGYIDLLERIREHTDHPVYAPEFRREIEESIAHAVEIAPAVRLVVTEGNYLLLNAEPWDGVRSRLDEVWFVHLQDSIRRSRLQARHTHYGLGTDAAETKTLGSDEANARLVNSSRGNPDVWVEVNADAPVDL